MMRKRTPAKRQCITRLLKGMFHCYICVLVFTSGCRGSLVVPYYTAEELGSSSYSGRVTTYPGGGQVVYLNPVNASGTQDILDTLYQGRWMDEQTRALFVDFTTYNGNINKFCNMRIAFEMPNYGGVISTLKFASVKLYRCPHIPGVMVQ